VRWRWKLCCQIWRWTILKSTTRYPSMYDRTLSTMKSSTPSRKTLGSPLKFPLNFRIFLAQYWIRMGTSSIPPSPSSIPPQQRATHREKCPRMIWVASRAARPDPNSSCSKIISWWVAFATKSTCLSLSFAKSSTSISKWAEFWPTYSHDRTSKKQAITKSLPSSTKKYST
jgi:hypothetical protein